MVVAKLDNGLGDAPWLVVLVPYYFYEGALVINCGLAYRRDPNELRSVLPLCFCPNTFTHFFFLILFNFLLSALVLFLNNHVCCNGVSAHSSQTLYSFLFCMHM